MIESLLQTMELPSELMPTPTLLLNLALGVAMSVVLSWHYVRFGKTYSNRRELAQVFPLIVLSTILIISLVQSDVALSLGLVGALSIVRFRTPVKEPEELAYLFAAISMGIGLGASQRLTTLVAMGVILAVVTVRSRVMGQTGPHNLFLNLELAEAGGEESAFRDLHSLLTGNVNAAQVRRLDVREGVLQATYSIDCPDTGKLISFMDDLRHSLPDAHISFVEQRGIPGL